MDANTYQEMEEFIMSIPKFSAKSTLEETSDFYNYLGKPGKNAKIFHVAGTNGKGSVCAYMNQIFIKEGITTGMFTSPHLVCMRERIRKNGNLITKEEFEILFKVLMDQISSFKKEKGKEEYFPSFFEFLFFLAMMYFEKEGTSIIILETGMGGRLDATNVVENPLICIITRIGMDHTEYLGTTIGMIAGEKAGIIKRGCKVIYSDNRQESTVVIEKKASETGVLCKSVTKCENHEISFGDKKIDFSFYSRYYGNVPFSLATVAFYQIENASLALTAIEESGIYVSRRSMEEGLRECRWEARMEEILPSVYLDGAHNEDGIEAFLQSVVADGCKGKRYLLFSVVADKEYKLMKERLTESHLFDEIYAVPIKNVRGLLKSDLEEIFLGEKVRILDSAKEGLKEVLEVKLEEDMVYITGSLYLAGEIKEVWE